MSDADAIAFARSQFYPRRPAHVRGEPKRACRRCAVRVGHRPGGLCWLCYEPRKPSPRTGDRP